MRGLCRTAEKWEKSDQRRYHVDCPHCGEGQPLEWDGLKWQRDTAGNVTQAWYVCRECGAMIEEHHKRPMLKDAKAGGAARWVAAHPERKLRGYHLNCLYYQPGMGPSWASWVWVRASWACHFASCLSSTSGSFPANRCGSRAAGSGHARFSLNGRYLVIVV